MNDDVIFPPWTEEQVSSLNGYQRSGYGHPFTCGISKCRGGAESRYAELLATTSGWVCLHCGYTQNWAWKFMTDNTWKQRDHGWSLVVFAGNHGDL